MSHARDRQHTACSMSRKHYVAENSNADSISATTLGRPGKRRGTTVATASRTIALAALAHAYLDDLRVRNFKPTTIQGYANRLGRFTRWAETGGAFSVQDFDSKLVKRYRKGSRPFLLGLLQPSVCSVCPSRSSDDPMLERWRRLFERNGFGPTGDAECVGLGMSG
jgi:hypothetical protein